MQRNIIEGSEFIIYDIDHRPIALSKNCALSLKQNLISVTNKDSLGWAESIAGSRDFTISFEGLVSFEDEFDTGYFSDQMMSGTPFFVKLGVIQANFDYSYWGEVAIESIEISAEHNGVTSYSGNLKGVGSLQSTNSGSPEQNGYIKTETDPVFRGSPAFNITTQNKNDWNTAYNNILQSIEFSTVDNTTTLFTTLKNGAKYSASFQNNTGSGGNESGVTSLNFNSSNGNLSVNSLFTNLDGRYQTIGDYVSSGFLSSNFYNKTQADDRYLQKISNTLQSVLSQGNTTTLDIISSAGISANTGKFTSALTIPMSAPGAPVDGDIWLGDIMGEGGSSPIGGASNLSDLLDVALTSLGSGQSLVYNGSKWINQNITVDLSNYFNKSESDGRYLTLHGTTDNTNLFGGAPITAFHRYYTFESDANTAPEHTSNFTYAVNAPYAGTLMHFGANGYGTQFNSNYGSGNGLSFRTRNGDTATWNPWYSVWHTGNITPDVNASANSVVKRDPNGYVEAGFFKSYISANNPNPNTPVSLYGNANTLDGYQYSFSQSSVRNFLNSSTGAVANSIVLRDSQGYINNVWYNSSRGEETTTAASYIYDSGDGYMRKKSTANASLELVDGQNRHHQFRYTTAGTAYNNGTLELMNGSAPPLLGFHYEGVVASCITIESSGRIAISNNPGTSYENLVANVLYGATGIQSADYIAAGGYIQGARGIFGYDTGVSGSVGASNWFRSGGATGWYNQDFGGGIYMADTTWIRTTGNKSFFVEGGQLLVTYGVTGSKMYSNNGGFKSNSYCGMVGNYDVQGNTDMIIWTIGDQWNELASMYGLGYSYSNAMRGGAHQLVLRQAGQVNASLGLDGTIMATTLIIPSTPSNAENAIWIS